MERREFLKGLLGLVGAAAAAKVGGELVDQSELTGWSEPITEGQVVRFEVEGEDYARDLRGKKLVQLQAGQHAQEVDFSGTYVNEGDVLKIGADMVGKQSISVSLQLNDLKGNNATILAELVGQEVMVRMPYDAVLTKMLVMSVEMTYPRVDLELITL
jgi:hypothetical protein